MRAIHALAILGLFKRVAPPLHRKNPLRRYLNCILFWNPLISGFFTLIFSGFSSFGTRFLISMIISCTVSTACFGGVALFRRIEIASFKRLRRAVPEHTGFWYIFLSCLIMPFGLYFGFYFAGKFSLLIGHAWSAPNLEDYRTGILWGLAIAGLFFLSESRRDAHEAQQAAELRLKRLENERLQAQIAALTAQMNPHLLFNALNTVASLVLSDPKLAEDTLLRLSELYRGVLASSKKVSHSLASELEICRAYLSVEQARFGSRLNVSIEVDPGIEAKRTEVPVLAIQPLVENAIRHGVASRAEGGNVLVKVNRAPNGMNVFIEDDGVGFGNSTKRGTGTGLANCRARLKLSYGDHGQLEIQARPEGGTRVFMAMPAFQNPIAGAYS